MTRPRTAAVRGASAALFLFLACATGSGQRGSAPPERNVVIVVWDGLSRQLEGKLLLAPTLFEAAQKAGIQTFALGKNGAAYLQDVKRGGMLLDEKTVLPLALARELQAAGISLPATAPNAHPPGAL